MSRYALKFITTVICPFIGACSIAPDIRDVTPLDTAAVVRHIECETQIAFLRTMARYLAENLKGEMQARLQEVLSEPDLVTQIRRLSNIKIEQLAALKATRPDIYKYLAAWGGVVIGYQYTFDIKENNDHLGNLHFSFPLAVGSLKIQTGTQLLKTRGNKKTFTVVTTIPLIMQSGACLGYYHLRERATQDESSFGVKGIEKHKETITNVKRTQHPNFMYPVTGQIGMEDVISTFAKIWWPTGSGRTTAPETTQKKGSQGNGTVPGEITLQGKVDTGYTQTLTFTTKIIGKVYPVIEVSGSHLTKGELKTENYREDTHKVMISFIPPTPQEIEKLRNLSLDTRETIAKDIARSIYPGFERDSISRVEAEGKNLRELLNRERMMQAFEQFGITHSGM